MSLLDFLSVCASVSQVVIAIALSVLAVAYLARG